MSKELKPCPFCNNAAAPEIITADELCVGGMTDPDQRTVVCSALNGGCGATCGYQDSDEEATEAWNRRTIDSATAELRKELEEVRHQLEVERDEVELKSACIAGMSEQAGTKDQN